jgi:diaminopimelate decarboxylase
MTSALPLHTEVEDFEIEDGCLCVGGRTLVDLAEQVGQTPFYVYDSRLIEKRIDKLRTELPSGVKLHYAIKANPMPDVVRLVAAHVDGLDVASAGEMRVALSTSCPPEEISMAGPGKSDRDLEDAVEAGITINVESEGEVGRLAAIAREAGRTPRLAVRVNPDFELKTAGMKMSGGPKQFGIDAERVPALLQHLTNLDVEFCGFHIYSGSQNLRADAICESQQKTFELALSLAHYAPDPPQFVNIGGGFGIPYFRGDEPLNLAPIGENLTTLLERRDRLLPGTDIVLELGRYMVAEAGLYVCRIVDRKLSRGHVFLVTDGGLHQHLAASGNFGQIIRKNYPVLIANRVGSTDVETASVVGPLCTPLDLLADKMELSRAEPGDLVAVFQSGAYGYTASPQLFLGHPPPVEILV